MKKKSLHAINRLHHRAAELTHLNNIMALLQWDQEVMMPSGGAEGRGAQVATLSSIIHQKICDPVLGNLLLEAAESSGEASARDRALVRVMQREHDRNTRMPEKFVAAFARLTSRALPVWVRARKENDFGLFLPLLEQIIAMCREKAGFLGYTDHPYDALLDLYEEGLTTRLLDPLFAGLRDELAPLLQQTASAVEKRDPLAGLAPMPRHDQVRFSETLLKEIGYDFNNGRQDVSAHPFTTSLGHRDRRVTNRFRPDSLEFIFSGLHEGGHALYEQNIAAELADSPLDEGVSLGIHESQSRLWENIIGRSRPFWQRYYPLLQEFFPRQFKDVGLDDFVRAINRVEPGMIRVEADEVSYNLHVLVRFELEKELLGGTLEAAELPGLWNDKYKSCLGVRVDSDANGVLQDIHWAHGSFGYFPTYTIGNLAAAQIWQAYRAFDPAWTETLQQGNLAKIRRWLTEKIYRFGGLYPPAELLQRVCGEELDSSHFLAYLKNKPEFCL